MTRPRVDLLQHCLNPKYVHSSLSNLLPHLTKQVIFERTFEEIRNGDYGTFIPHFVLEVFSFVRYTEIVYENTFLRQHPDLQGNNMYPGNYAKY